MLGLKNHGKLNPVQHIGLIQHGLRYPERLNR